MTDGHIFVSYPRTHRSDVKEVVDYLNEVLGGRTWFDRKIHVGHFETQIRKQIEAASGMIVFLTKDSVGPDSSGWIEHEIATAIDNGMELILPCIVGDFIPPRGLKEKLQAFHQIYCDDIKTLPGKKQFRDQIAFFKDVLDGKSAPEGHPKHADHTVDSWLAKKPGPQETALALTIAVLEYRPADLVLALAQDLQSKLEELLRPKSSDEIEAEPRELGFSTTTERLNAIGAEKVDLEDTSGSLHKDIIRFKERDTATALLSHVWDEVQDLRDVLLNWMNQLLEDRGATTIGEEIASSFGVFAQRNFAAIRFRFLNEWLFHDSPTLVDMKISSAETILSAAVESPDNAEQVKDLLAELTRGDLASRQIAAALALGPVGFRRPDIAVFVLRRIGRMTFENHHLFELISNRPAIYGAKTDVASSEQDHWFTQGDEKTPRDEVPNPEKEGQPPDISREDNDMTDRKDESDPSTPSDVHAKKDKNTDGSGEDRTPSKNTYAGAIPAARFLAALANWADEKITDPNKLITRQVPLFWLLLAFEKMPYLTLSQKSQRLTLEDLVCDIREREPEIYDAIVRGFVRAALARKINGSRYPALTHMQYALRSFAKMRRPVADEPIRLPKNSNTDPFLTFASSIYHKLKQIDAHAAPYVFERSGRFLTEEDVSLIRTDAPEPIA